MPASTGARGRLGPIGRAPALLSLVLGLLVTLALLGSGAASSQAAPVAAPGSAVAGAAATVPSAPVGDERPGAEAVDDPASESTRAPARTGIFAHVDGLDLHRPSDDLVLVGFHQASRPGSLAMEPMGEATRVLPSRGRPYPRTSAADIVLVDDDAVRAPVTGRVVEVESYALYGRHPDRRVTIRPKGRPEVRVVLLHVEGVRVEVGDRVEGGETVIARTARAFPFRSQVDEETAPHAWPHVHLEVKAVSRR